MSRTHDPFAGKYVGDPKPVTAAAATASALGLRRVGTVAAAMKPSDLRRYVVRGGKVTIIPPGETLPVTPELVASAKAEIAKRSAARKVPKQPPAQSVEKTHHDADASKVSGLRRNAIASSHPAHQALYRTAHAAHNKKFHMPRADGSRGYPCSIGAN